MREEKRIERMLERLSENNRGVYPIFGGAFLVCANEVPDIECLIRCLPSVVTNARFWGWQKGVNHALRTFCHICCVDPRLIEMCIGISFDDF